MWGDLARRLGWTFVVRVGKKEKRCSPGETPRHSEHLLSVLLSQASQDVSSHKTENDPKTLLHHAERVLYLRIGAGVVLYIAFTILDISAALSHTMQERAPLLLGLLIASIFALPRQVIRRDLIERLEPGQERTDWIERMKRIQYWLVWVRGIFFLGALVLFLGLPEIV